MDREQDLGLYTTAESVRGRLVEVGFTNEEIAKSGLTVDKRWQGRLVAPWRDRYGKIGTFWARDLSGQAEDAEKYLYLTTKTTWGGRPKAELVAFGLDGALRTNEGRQSLKLVEGLLDVLRLQALGFMSVAGIGGSGRELSPERWKALKGFGIPSVTLALDYDPKAEPCRVHNLAHCYPCSPGMTGTLEAIDKASKLDNAPDVYVVAPEDLYIAADRPIENGCPVKVDPDDLVRRKGLEAFRAVLERRRAATLFRSLSILGNVSPSSSVEQRKRTAEELLEFVGRLRGYERLYREEILIQASERLKFPRQILEALAEDLSDQRQREATELMAISLISDGLHELTSSHDLGIITKLSESLASLQVSAVDTPPPFQVDRLDAESRRLPAGRRSGWRALDESLEVRFVSGELAVVAARTGHLKTSLLVGLLANQLREYRDETFVFYTAEEPEICIYHRFLALLSEEGGDLWSIREIRDYLRDQHSRSLWPNPEALRFACQVIRSWEGRLFVVYRPSWTIAEIETHARSIADRRKMGAIFADYLQRIPPPIGRYERRDIEVSTVGRRLKDLAVQLSLPVVAAAQINREAVPSKYRERLAGKTYADAKLIIRQARPELHHLREGGAEQEADMVLGLLNYAADYQADENTFVGVPKVTLVEVGTLKQRYGPRGKWVPLALSGRAQLIRDPADEGEV